MNRKLFLISQVVLIALLAAAAVAGVARARKGGSQGVAQSMAIPQPMGQQVKSPASPLAPVGSGFAYQGRLTASGSPANGQFDLRFTLFDASSTGNQVGSPVTVISQTVSDGLFTTQLDFGSNAFQGSARWIELGVRPGGGSGSFTTLLPRQPLTPAPYAMSLMPGAIITGTGGTAILSAINATTGDGLHGQSNNGIGVYGNSSTNEGVRGDAYTAFAGVNGTNFSNGPGVYGFSSSGSGVYGTSDSGYGVFGITNDPVRSGIFGLSVVTDGLAMIASAPNGLNARGLYAEVGSGYGVYGRANATSGWGVTGISNNTGDARGVYGESTGSTGYGLSGYSIDGTGATGASTTGTGVSGFSTSGTGVYGFSDTGAGMFAYANGVGVFADSPNGTAIYGLSANGNAGYFDGKVSVTGTVTVTGNMTVTGYIFKLGGGFVMDHPQDPAGKFLYHSFVESPDMMNIYNGNVTTDAKGDATVTMPGYFQALNQDFRYQLTVMGQFAQAIVASEIANNRFNIKTDKPNVKVSWQVTGIRHDPYAQTNPIPVELDKSASQQGLYLHPELYGQPASKQLDPQPAASKQTPPAKAAPSGKK
jgi:hypothetical protein